MEPYMPEEVPYNNITYTGTKMDQPLATSLGMETADATVSFKNQPMKLMTFMT